MTITETYKSNFQPGIQPEVYGMLKNTALYEGKKSFLVFKNNKYQTISTDLIAFIHTKYASSMIMTFHGQEYSIVPSLDQLQHVLSEKQFFRVSRQCLINFHAVKEVEHYFARKLLVNLIVPGPGPLLVTKERKKSFFDWLENR